MCQAHQINYFYSKFYPHLRNTCGRTEMHVSLSAHRKIFTTTKKWGWYAGMHVEMQYDVMSIILSKWDYAWMRAFHSTLCNTVGRLQNQTVGWWMAPGGCHCLKQCRQAKTGRNLWSTSHWILKGDNYLGWDYGGILKTLASMIDLMHVLNTSETIGYKQ